MRNLTMMNIYEQLGAKPGKSSSEYPIVYKDGTANEETIAWALKELGFISTPEIQFSNWIESQDRTNVVPFRCSSKGLSIILHPVDITSKSEMGCFRVEYGSMDKKGLMLSAGEVFKPSQIQEVLKLTREVVERKKALVPKAAKDRTGTESKYHYSRDENQWYHDGKPCYITDLLLADGTHGPYPVYYKEPVVAKKEEPTVKVIVAGGRDFDDYGLLKSKLDKIFSQTDKNKIQIISGKARGADQLGEQYATENKLELSTFPADWDKHGKGAGYLRNAEMAAHATHCVIFWDGKSKGTQHMLNLANEKGLKLRVIRYT